jgi:hypothetical protein
LLKTVSPENVELIIQHRPFLITIPKATAVHPILRFNRTLVTTIFPPYFKERSGGNLPCGSQVTTTIVLACNFSDSYSQTRLVHSILGDKKNNVRVFHLNSPTQHDVVQKSVWDSVWELFYRLLW